MSSQRASTISTPATARSTDGFGGSHAWPSAAAAASASASGVSGSQLAPTMSGAPHRRSVIAPSRSAGAHRRAHQRASSAVRPVATHSPPPTPAAVPFKHGSAQSRTGRSSAHAPPRRLAASSARPPASRIAVPIKRRTLFPAPAAPPPPPAALAPFAAALSRFFCARASSAWTAARYTRHSPLTCATASARDEPANSLSEPTSGFHFLFHDAPPMASATAWPRVSTVMWPSRDEFCSSRTQHSSSSARGSFPFRLRAFPAAPPPASPSASSSPAGAGIGAAFAPLSAGCLRDRDFGASFGGPHVDGSNAEYVFAAAPSAAGAAAFRDGFRFVGTVSQPASSSFRADAGSCSHWSSSW